MAHSERCPVCYGTGKCTEETDRQSTAVPQPRPCHGCGGLGWVTVQDDIGELPDKSVPIPKLYDHDEEYCLT